MKLIWVRNPNPALVGQEVKVNDSGETSRGEPIVVNYFRPPHKPSSEGKVSVQFVASNGVISAGTMEYYVGVIGAAWVDREDQG